MPIVASDIHHKYSVLGSAGNPQSNPDSSIGGSISSTQIADNTINNDMNDITSAEASSGIIIYRGYFYQNKHATLTFISPRIWIESQTSSSNTDVALALTSEEKNLDIERLANETTAPIGPSFSQPANYAAGLELGSLAPDDYRGQWVKYTVNAGASATLDTYTLAVRGDTNP